MAVDAGIIQRGLAQFQQPADPIDRYGRVLALQNGVRQGQIQQQQLQEGSLDLQQKQKQITGQQLLDEAFKTAFVPGPDGTPTINKEAVVQHLSAAGQGHQVPGLLENFAKLDKSAADAKEAQIKAKTAADDYTANGLMTIYDAKFDPSIALGTIAHARATGAIPPDEAAQIAMAINANPTPQTVQSLIQPRLDKSPAFQKLADSRKTAQAAVDSAAARKTTAETGQTKLNAELPVLQAEADQKVRSNLAAKLGTAATPEEYNAILGEVPLKVAKDFIGKTPEQARRLGMTAEQQTQADMAEVKEKREAADAKSHLAIANADLDLKRKTFAITQENSKNLGLQGVPPHLAGAATSDYVKAGNEYATASAAADTMQTVLNLAEKGNKAAGSNLPLVGVETLNAINGIKRINGAEIAQYGTAGSLLDEIKGKLGKITEGKPIPQDVLNDIRELHSQISKQAATTYARKVQTANQAYGSKFKPIEFAADAPPAVAAPAAYRVGDTVNYNGAPHKIKEIRPDGKVVLEN